MENLTLQYRLIWDPSTHFIKNKHTKNYSGSATAIINPENIGFFESDVYQDILDKISAESLIPDPSIFR